MNKPNSELFRLLRFAIKYPNSWHVYHTGMRKHIKRGVDLGFFERDIKTKQFRLVRGS